jgi:hypothetical protein
MSRILCEIDELIDDRVFDRDLASGSQVKLNRDMEIRGMKKARKLICREVRSLEELKSRIFVKLLTLSEPEKFGGKFSSERSRTAQLEILKQAVIEAGLIHEFNDYYEGCMNVWEEKYGKND